MTMSEKRVQFYSCRLLTLLTIEKLTFFFSFGLLHLGGVLTVNRICTFSCFNIAYCIYKSDEWQNLKIGFSQVAVYSWAFNPRVVIRDNNYCCPQSTSAPHIRTIGIWKELDQPHLTAVLCLLRCTEPWKHIRKTSKVEFKSTGFLLIFFRSNPNFLTWCITEHPCFLFQPIWFYLLLIIMSVGAWISWFKNSKFYTHINVLHVNVSSLEYPI